MGQGLGTLVLRQDRFRVYRESQLDEPSLSLLLKELLRERDEQREKNRYV